MENVLCSEYVIMCRRRNNKQQGTDVKLNDVEFCVAFFYWFWTSSYLLLHFLSTPSMHLNQADIYSSLEIYIWSRVCVSYQVTITTTWVGSDSCRKRQFGDSARTVPAEVFTNYALYFYAAHLCKVFVWYCREQTQRGRAVWDALLGRQNSHCDWLFIHFLSQIISPHCSASKGMNDVTFLHAGLLKYSD